MHTDRLRRWLTVPLVLIPLAAAGCNRGAGKEKEKEAPRVTVAHPAVQSLMDEDDYNGRLEASQTVEVRARVRGHIQKVHFKDGDQVRKDQLLFELDPRPFQAEIDQAMAEAKALDAQKVAAEKDMVRQEELLKAKAVALSEYEKAVADAQSYNARIAAKMQVVATRKLDLEFSRITAAIAGKVSRAMLTEGNLVNAGGSDPLLTTIVAVDPIYVDFNIDERAMQRYQQVSMGRKDKDNKDNKDNKESLREQKIGFSFGLDTEKGFPHQGVLVFADNKYTAGTGTILVRGQAKNPDGVLVPGSNVRVRIPVSDKYEAVVVPDTAVLADVDKRYLLVLGKDNVVLRRDIVPGRLLDDGQRVVLPSPGEKADKAWSKSWTDAWVVTVGLQRARIDYPVQPLDADGQPIAAASAAK